MSCKTSLFGGRRAFLTSDGVYNITFLMIPKNRKIQGVVLKEQQICSLAHPMT